VQHQQAKATSNMTVFAKAEASLRQRLQTAAIDGREFQRPLARCSLSHCRGTCCHDGVPVDDDTADVVQRLATERAADFRELGLSLPNGVIVENEWRGAVSKKTAVRPFPFRSLVREYPDHFEETACVFLLDDGRCGLQVLAQRDGEHPWHYKPFACWLHPIKITNSAIHLYDEASDPQRYPGYDGFVSRTFCGRTAHDGCPAAELLKNELQYLGRILNRDLLAEVQGQSRREGTASDAA
jgi:hypothetical protein